MKKLFAVAAVVASMALGAQTQKGNYLVESAVLSNLDAPNTGLGYSSEKGGAKVFNVGLNGGYFVEDNLAVKAGVGYGNTRLNESTVAEAWSFRGGLEYNISQYVPVEAGWAGSVFAKDSTSFVYTQVGFNWFLTDKVAVKPLVRYSFSLKDNAEDVFSTGVGFGFYF